MPANPYWTTRDVAHRLDVSPRMIRKLVQNGVINSTKVSGQHLFLSTEVERVARLDRPSGRPPNS